jgi:hypothetical protein
VVDVWGSCLHGDTGTRPRKGIASFTFVACRAEQARTTKESVSSEFLKTRVKNNH